MQRPVRKKNRDKIVVSRFTADESKALSAYAKANSISISDILRHGALLLLKDANFLANNPQQ
jgi:hypothetical protein